VTRLRKKPVVEEIAISEFKAKCLSLLEEVNKTGCPLRITRHGKPIAEVIPPSPATVEEDWLGSMTESTEILGDIVSPVIDVRKIEALK